MGADRSLDVLADLHLEITDDRGFTHVHLSGGPDELVLDIDDPAVALRAGLGARRVRRVSRIIPDGAFRGVRMLVQSDGRALARVRFTAAGAVRAVPTIAGVRVVGAAGAGSTAVRGGVVAVVVAVGAVVVTARRRRAGVV